MRREVLCRLCGSLLLLGLTATPCWAVIIFEKGRDEPIRGFLVSADEIRVIVNLELPGGGTRKRILPRASIDQIIETVQPDRLGALDPANPQDYRSYADDLSEKRLDPEARQTALRLYLIAAYLAPAELGRGCLLAMADLANDETDQRKYRAMVYLLDAAHDRRILSVAERSRPSLDLEIDQRKLLLDGLYALRKGRRTDAGGFARRQSFRDLLEPFADYLTNEQYAAAVSNGVSPEILRRIVALELILAVPPIEVAPIPAKTNAWSAVAVDETVTELSLESVGPYDPRLCVYRGGEWVRDDE